MAESKSPSSVAWRGACLVCRAVFDFLYTTLVIGLAILVATVAYLATLEEIPAPQALISQLETAAEKHGLAFHMKGIRFKPNGQVSIDQLSVRSIGLSAEIAAAKSASIKVDPALLLLGIVRLTEINVSDGSLTVPPVMSATGLPETFAKHIDLSLKKRWDTWEVRHGKLSFYNARLYAAGRLKIEPSPDQAPFSPKEFLRKTLPEIWKAKDAVEKLAEPSVSLQFDYKGPQDLQASATATVSKVPLPQNSSLSDVVLTAELAEDGSIAATLKSAAVKLADQATARNLVIRTGWEQLPPAEKLWPERATLSLARASRDGLASEGIAAAARIESLDSIQIDSQFTFNGQFWKLDAQGDPAALTGTAQLEGTIAQPLIDAVRPLIPEQFRSIHAHGQPAEISLRARFDGKPRPETVEASLIANRVEIAGAQFEQAIARARIDGPLLNAQDLWLRSGKQSGWMGISYNLDTRKRRFLIDGVFNPTNLNGWFQPWWSGFWDNFQFQEEGFEVVMDSQATFLQPDTLRITGSGRGRDIGVRGHAMKDVDLDFFIRLHYFDLYNIQLEREEGSLSGETQIALERDPRDGIEKLVALWVDARSGIDVMIGPDVIREVAEDTAAILAPYRYEKPPHLIAKASSSRIRDHYQFDTDIQIDTSNPISFFGYPFESLQASVSVDNQRIEIRDAQAGLAGGNLKAAADVVGDSIQLDAALENAHFGDTLFATSTYFKNNGETSDPDFDNAKLHDYGGKFNASFKGEGTVGDVLSYTGDGKYEIRGANFGQIQLFGLFSKALEGTPLQFTTLKFNDGVGKFAAKKRYLEFPDLKITGPIAQINSSGKYDLQEETLDFKATFFPFRQSKMPVIALIGFALEPMSRVMEVRLGGTLTKPEWSLFNTAPEPAAPEDGKIKLPEITIPESIQQPESDPERSGLGQAEPLQNSVRP